MPATRKISPAFRAFLLPLILGLLSAPLLAAPAEQVIQITAQRFHYTPNEINLKKGVPVVLEFTSLDVKHGFTCPEFKIRADIPPKKVTKVRFTPDRVGTFEFHCDNFCGSGHADMAGKFIVSE